MSLHLILVRQALLARTDPADLHVWRGGVAGFRLFALVGIGLLLALSLGCGERVPVDVTSTPFTSPLATAFPGDFVTPGQLAPIESESIRLVETFTLIRDDAFADRVVFLTEVPDGEGLLAVVTQTGAVVTFQNDPDVKSFDLLLDISDRVSRDGDEEGLLGLAFDPDYAENGEFFVYYSAADPLRSVLSRFVTGDSGLADPSSEVVILEIEAPFSNHNGGMIEFGPDGMLYIGVGDGGSGGNPNGNGQNMGTLLGSVLRILPQSARQGDSYRVPETNPFVGSDDARVEIWEYGFRNPWRFRFDSATGDLWLADVGEQLREGIDLVVRGRATTAGIGLKAAVVFHLGVTATTPAPSPPWGSTTTRLAARSPADTCIEASRSIG